MMKRTGLFFASMLLAGSSAYAQSNVTLYGLLDVGVASRSGGDGGAPSAKRKTELGSGMGAGGNRWGLKGSEQLTPGMTAFFELEWGFDADTGDGTRTGANSGGDNVMRTRHNYLGLTGTYGTFLLGRVDGGRATFSKVYDPFKGVGVGNFGGLAHQLTVVNNAAVYITPEIKGLSVTTAYVTAAVGDELPGNKGDVRIYVIWPTYKIGNLQISYDHEEVWVAKSQYSRLRVNDIGLTYDFGVAKLFAQFDDMSSKHGSFGNALLDDQQAWMLGTTVPIGQGVFKASFAHLERDNFINYTCKKYAVGYTYNMSKRTSFYADAAIINNSSGASCQLGLRNEDGNNEDFAGKPQYGTKGINIGMAHSF